MVLSSRNGMKKKKVKEIQKKYNKWVLKLEKQTSNKIVLDETKRKKITIITDIMVERYERRMNRTRNKYCRSARNKNNVIMKPSRQVEILRKKLLQILEGKEN